MAFNCAHERYDNQMPCPHFPGNDNYSGGFQRAHAHVRHIRRYHKSRVPDDDPSKIAGEHPDAEQPENRSAVEEAEG